MESLLVGIDVGCRRHRVAVGMPDGASLDQFDLEHQPAAFSAFFSRVEKQAVKHGLSVSVGMEGYGGWARPLDEMVLAKGWTLLNVNNLKLAGPALYTQVTSQNHCTWVRPRRGAQPMVVPLASIATQVWPVCNGSLRASRPAAICCVALSCNGTTIPSRARLAYDHRATRCGATCV